ESPHAHVRGVVMREARGPAWPDWLREQAVVALSGVDTRSLVLHLREHGSMRAGIVAGEASVDDLLAGVRERPRMAGRSLVAEVSTKQPYSMGSGRLRIALVDYGCKRSIVRRLVAAGAAVTVFPHDADPETLGGYEGVLLSNGPGDPEPL